MGDAEVEVAEQVLVHEVEPEPAADVAVGGEGDLPVAGWMKWKGAGWPWVGLARPARMCQGAAMARKTRSGGEGVELAEAGRVPAEAAGEQEVEEDDGDGEDDADEAFGEDVEGAGGGEERSS